MKNFYRESMGLPTATHVGAEADVPYIRTRARVAVYDSLASAPYVEDVGPSVAPRYVESLASRVYELARERGGAIPYTVVREVAENLVHADFSEPVVSVLDEGRTIRFSDQGPGIPDKRKALEPGFTTATEAMKHLIRGVGSGLPIAREFLALSGGSLVIEDNLSGGTVVTLRCGSICDSLTPSAESTAAGSSPADTLPAPTGSKKNTAPSEHGNQASLLPADTGTVVEAEPVSRLTTRQKHVMALVLETGSAGPSIVSKELGVGLSTAYRDLASLEDLGLIEADGGKRTLTAKGVAYLGSVSSSPE